MCGCPAQDHSTIMRSSRQRRRRGSSTTVAAAVVLAACLGRGAGSTPGYPGAVGGGATLPQRPGQPVRERKVSVFSARYVRISICFGTGC